MDIDDLSIAAARIAYNESKKILADGNALPALKVQALKTMTALADWDDGQGA